MDVQLLHRRIAALATTLGERLAWGLAVERLDADHAAALVDLAGLNVIPALIEAGAPPALLRAAIETAVTQRHWDLREVERTTLAAWCRQAAFSAPETLPGAVDLYRGTIGCSAAETATGLHWSTRFEAAAWYGARFADAALTGVIVLHARVPRCGIAAFISGTADDEVVPAEVPAAFEVISDAGPIADAAVRWDHHLTELKAQGWASVKSYERSRQVAMAARARMATQIPA